MRTWVNRGLNLAKITKRKKKFTFTDVHMSRQKVPKSDFQSQFSMSKIFQISLNFFLSLKNISLIEAFLILSFFENFNCWTTFLKWCPISDGPCEHLRKIIQKIICILLIFSLKSCWHVRKTPPLRSHYTQYPIIRNGHIRNRAEFLGKFKKRALGGSNLRNAPKNFRSGQCSDFQS